MNKILKTLLTAFCVCSTALTVNAAAIKGDVRSELIPTGTVITVTAANPVDSASLIPGARFDVITTSDILSQGKMLLPKGTVIRGSVVDINNKKMLSKDASVYVKFDHLVSPTGDQIPVALGLRPASKVKYDGGLGYGGNYASASRQNVSNAGTIIKTMTNWGIETGNKVDPAGWPKYFLTPVSAILSVPTAGIYLVSDEIVDIFKSGKDISVAQGESFDVVFLKGVSVPTH